MAVVIVLSQQAVQELVNRLPRKRACTTGRVKQQALQCRAGSWQAKQATHSTHPFLSMLAPANALANTAEDGSSYM